MKKKQNKRMKGKGGRRQRLKHNDGDDPLCMRKKMKNGKQK